MLQFRWGYVIGILLLLLPIITGFSYHTFPQYNKSENLFEKSESFYTPHDPIEIDSDNDFVTQGWPGSGTQEEPYLIAGLEIETDSDCIVIGNTTVVFEIRDCIFNSTGYSSLGIGLRMVNITNAQVSSCSFIRKARGIEITNSNSSIISGNTHEYNGYGIYCATSLNLSIEINTLRNCSYGIYTIDSSNMTVFSNTIFGYANYGFLASSCFDLNITGNELRDSEYDIFAGNQMYLQDIENSTIANNVFVNRLENSLKLYLCSCVLENNTFTNGGIYSDNWYDLTLIDNKVNGKLLGHFTNLTDNDIDVSNYGQLFIDNCNNTIFRNGNLSNTAIGIMMRDCYNSTIREISVNSCNNGGILVRNSPRSQVMNCNMSFNKDAALKIYSSANSTVTSNILLGNEDAIYSSYSERSVISGNTIAEGFFYGFWSKGIYVHGTNYTIYDNSIDECRTGIELHQAYNSTTTNNTISNCSDGIYCVFTEDAFIMNNTLLKNGKGLYMYGSENCTCIFNNITMNLYMGVDVSDDSRDLLLYGNWITWNHLEATDDGTDCQWDDGVSIGNTWGDYSGEGYYYLPGSAGSYDRFPSRIIDNTPPSLEGLPDREIEQGDISQRLQWNADDEHPDSFQIYLDDDLLWTVRWYGPGSPLTPYPSYDPRDLNTGVHNITVVVYDGAGNSAVDTVFITVISSTAPSISSPDDITYTEGETGHTIMWECSDYSPYLYSILLDESEIESGLWNGSNIAISVDGFTPGQYSYTLELMDHSINEVSDTVIVVVETTSSTTSTTTSSTNITTTNTSTTTNTTQAVPILPEIIVLITTATITAIIAIVVWGLKKK